MVRVQVANVAPQISGQIVEVRTHDNQHVHKGDILYVIEKFDFEVALENAKATIQNRVADLEVKRAQNDRRAALSLLSTSIEQKQVFDGAAKMAEAALASAKAGLVRRHRQDRASARLHLRTSEPDVKRSRRNPGSDTRKWALCSLPPFYKGRCLPGTKSVRDCNAPPKSSPTY